MGSSLIWVPLGPGSSLIWVPPGPGILTYMGPPGPWGGWVGRLVFFLAGRCFSWPGGVFPGQPGREKHYSGGAHCYLLHETSDSMPQVQLAVCIRVSWAPCRTCLSPGRERLLLAGKNTALGMCICAAICCTSTISALPACVWPSFCSISDSPACCLTNI